MEKIILCTDGSTFSETNYQYGAWFAQQCSAPIEVLYLSERRHSKRKLKNLSGSIGFNASESLLERIVQVEHDYARLEQEKSAEILSHAQEVFETAGLYGNSYVHHEGDLIEDLREEEAQADLVIIGKCGSTGLSAERHIGSQVERMMRSLAKPCLVTCKAYKPVDKIMLAYDASPPCKAAFLQLIQLPFIQNHELHLVQVVKQEDLPALSHLKELQSQAQAAKIETKIKLMTGDIEDSLQSYIAQHEMSLLVMGIHGNRPIRSLIVGHTATHMVQETQIPVLLYR